MNMKKTISLLCAAAMTLAFGVGLQAEPASQPVQAEPAATCTLNSPENTLTLQFMLQEDGTPQYALKHGATDVILPSRLGFDLRGSLRPCIMKLQENG